MPWDDIRKAITQPYSWSDLLPQNRLKLFGKVAADAIGDKPVHDDRIEQSMDPMDFIPVDTAGNVAVKGALAAKGIAARAGGALFPGIAESLARPAAEAAESAATPLVRRIVAESTQAPLDTSVARTSPNLSDLTGKGLERWVTPDGEYVRGEFINGNLKRSNGAVSLPAGEATPLIAYPDVTSAPSISQVGSTVSSQAPSQGWDGIAQSIAQNAPSSPLSKVAMPAIGATAAAASNTPAAAASSEDDSDESDAN